MATRYQEYEYSDSGGLGKLLLLVLAGLALLAAGYFLLQELAGEQQVEVVNGTHAVQKHGEEAAQIQECLDSNGPNQVWKFTSHRRDNHFIQCAEMDDDFWGIRIIERLTGGKYKERTSFVVKDGTFQQMIEYVSARAEQFFGPLP
jgi:hypothetical protein